jgi:hypothetical protein
LHSLTLEGETELLYSMTKYVRILYRYSSFKSVLLRRVFIICSGAVMTALGIAIFYLLKVVLAYSAIYRSILLLLA